LKNHKKYKKVVITPEYDEKCKLVAKYLHHYPAGRDKKEKHAINRFLIGTNNHIPCTCSKDCKKIISKQKYTVVLRRYVKKYIKILHNIEAKEILCIMHAMNFPAEVKQRILYESLRNKAQKYYALSNTVQFIGIAPRALDTYKSLYKANRRKELKDYFLSEINEKNNIIMMFVDGGDVDFLSFFYLNCNVPNVEKFNELRSFYHANFFSRASDDYCPYHTHPTYQKFVWAYWDCNLTQLADLDSFLDAKRDRVTAFKNKFTEQVDLLLAKKDTEELVKAYIDLLKSFKMQLPENLKHLS
jgi:hypothetical protein